MRITEVIQAIENELMNPLPGKDFQMQMSSMKYRREIMDQTQINEGVKSSVLIVLYPSLKENETSIVLIQRPSYEGVHGGQISLPGGRSEKTDQNLKETAIREAREEIGIDPGKIIIIGVLSELYIPPSNYLVLPVVGYVLKRPEFKADPKEVAEIIEINLGDLVNNDNIKHKNIYIRPDFHVFGPCFQIGKHTIWGATAMILNEFREILNRISK